VAAKLTDVIADRMFQINEKTRHLTLVCFIDQHAPLRQQRLESFKHDIDQGFE